MGQMGWIRWWLLSWKVVVIVGTAGTAVAVAAGRTVATAATAPAPGNERGAPAATVRQQNNEIKEIQASCEQQKAKYLRGAISSLQAEIHDLKQNVALSHPFEVEMRHAVEGIGRLKATFTRRGIALSMLNVANTQ